MTIDGAIIREQGMAFGIMVVKPWILTNPTRRSEVVTQASRIFGGIPTVLMAQQNGGARYFGRRDIVQFMRTVPLAAVPWKRYSL